MKRLLMSLIACLYLSILAAQNVGIGTTVPVEKLDINGGVKVGASNNTNPGTIRWNAITNDFEGYNGKAWVSLTGGKGIWGNQQSFITENEASQHYLYSSGDQMGDYLGESLAMDNDMVIAGARGDFSTHSPNADSYAGTAHLYLKNWQGWTRTRILHNPTPEWGENFGSAVGIHNNYIIVGAPSAKVNGVDKGEAYIFQYDPVTGNCTLRATLAAFDGQQYDSYGYSVAIHGDIAAVGVPLKDVQGLDASGATFAYKRTGNTWTQIGYLYPADRAADDRFGHNVAVSGNRFAVSAHMADVNGIANAGKVYIYQLNSAGNGFIYHSTVTAPDPLIYEEFGRAIHITGDTLVVGAHQYRGSTTDSNGRVMIYIRNGNTWQHRQTVTASDGRKSDAFGTSVHIKGDQLIVGARRATVGSNPSQGKAYMFKYDGTTWQQQAIFTNSDGDIGSSFGNVVVTNGNDAVVAAHNSTFGGYRSHGRVYFFHK